MGYIPFGTGNDFSIATGFGPDLPSIILKDPYKGICERIKLWLESDRKLFDIWDTELELCDNGYIHNVKKHDNGFDKVKQESFDMLEGKDKIVTHFNRKMSNYMSIGICARIGFGFDKSRTSSKICNKLIYGWEGLKKFMFKSSNVNKCIESLKIIDEFACTD